MDVQQEDKFGKRAKIKRNAEKPVGFEDVTFHSHRLKHRCIRSQIISANSLFVNYTLVASGTHFASEIPTHTQRFREFYMCNLKTQLIHTHSRGSLRLSFVIRFNDGIR